MTKSFSRPIRIGVVGLGKIARDQHLPAIEKNPDFELAFLADKAVRTDLSAPHFNSLDEALKSKIAFDAIALCTSPQPRLELYERLKCSRCSILLEKPAAATFQQALSIQSSARTTQRNVFAAWHSKFAPQVSAARSWMQNRELADGFIEWRESASKWHPGQDWLWREGGFGVFDPGMNALSILTEILPNPIQVESAKLSIPENSATPTLSNFKLLHGTAFIDAIFEFHERETETWDIHLNAKDGSKLSLLEGGSRLIIDEQPVPYVAPSEYKDVYDHFATLIRENRSDVDIGPLRIIDEIFETAEIETAPSINTAV